MQYKNKFFHVENISTEKLVKKFNTPMNYSQIISKSIKEILH